MRASLYFLLYFFGLLFIVVDLSVFYNVWASYTSQISFHFYRLFCYKLYIHISLSSCQSVICKSTRPENYIPVVMSPLKHTSPPSMAATFLATCLIAVLQPSGYSVFHDGDTPIQLGLPWRSYSCQCLNTETSAQGNRGFITETPSISYIISLYIRLVVTL